MKKAHGISGIFFKVKSPKQTRQWYKNHLGLNTDEYGSNFEWHQADDESKKGFTQWSPFNNSSDYFDQDSMINYRVSNPIECQTT